MKPHRMLAAALVLSFADPTRAATLTVAAAADLKFAMTELVAGFQAAHPGDKIEVVYGSSGKTNTQIQQGAPYDLFGLQMLCSNGHLHPRMLDELAPWADA